MSTQTMTCRTCGKAVPYSESLNICPHCGTSSPGWVVVMQTSRNPLAEKHKHLAGEYYAQGDKLEAIAEFKRAAEIDPQDTASLNNIGAICSELGRYDEAISYLRMALALDPELGPAKRQLQRLQELTGRQGPPAPSATTAGEAAPAVPAAAATPVSLAEDVAAALKASRKPVDTSILAAVDKVRTGKDLENPARAFLFLRLAQKTLPHSLAKAQGYWEQLAKIRNELPPEYLPEVNALKAGLEPPKEKKEEAPKGWVAEALAEIEAAEKAAETNRAEAAQRLRASEAALKKRFMPMGKEPVKIALARAWINVDRRVTLESLGDLPDEVSKAFLSVMNRASILLPAEWGILAGKLGEGKTLELLRGLLQEPGQTVCLPKPLLFAFAKQLREWAQKAYPDASEACQSIVRKRLDEYLHLLTAQVGADPADVTALYDELYLSFVKPTVSPSWFLRFTWIGRVVLEGVRLRLLTEASLDRLLPLTPVYAAGYVRAHHAALSVLPGQVETAFRALRGRTGSDPKACAWFLSVVVKRGLGQEALSAADASGDEELRRLVRRTWLSTEAASAVAAISPGDMAGDPVGGFLAQKTVADRVSFLRTATNRGEQGLPGPLWVVPPPPKQGGLRGLFVAEKKLDEFVQEYADRTPLYITMSQATIKEDAWFAEYLRTLGLNQYRYKDVDGRLLEALVAWGDQDAGEVKKAVQAMWQAILPHDNLVISDWMRNAILERCYTVLAAEPDVLTGEFAVRMKKEWVDKGHTIKVSGQDMDFRLPKEYPFRMCLLGAMAVLPYSAERGESIIRKALGRYDADNALVTAAARVYGTGKKPLDLTATPQIKRGQVAAWQIGILENAMPAVEAALAAGTVQDASPCDMCGTATSVKEGAILTAPEFRQLVANGFEPDEALIQRMALVGISKEQAVEGWKRDLVEPSPTDWLLCPKCAGRAARYRAAA